MQRVLIILALTIATATCQLVRGNATKCIERKTESDAFFNDHHYLYSWTKPATNFTYNWINGRNFCRERCMDLVSIESNEENDFIKNAILTGGVDYAWTSGRLCNFPGCDQPHLLPNEIKGWFWSGSMKLMPATTDRIEAHWANVSAFQDQVQPDRREGVEACMAILHPKIYNDDDFNWHDIHCGHVKPIICEDSEELLSFARFNNPNLDI